MAPLNRAERHRRDRQKPGEGLAIALRPALLAPGHWHVDAVAYEHEIDGDAFNAVHVHNVVSNDLVLTESFVLRQVKPLSGPPREKVRVEEIRYCDDREHLETAQTDLIRPGD